MGKRFTEGICGDGAAILDNGKQITITEILNNLNKLDELEKLTDRNIFFKVTFAFDKNKEGRTIWNFEEKVFGVASAEELDTKIKQYITLCSSRLVDRRYRMRHTKIEKM